MAAAGRRALCRDPRARACAAGHGSCGGRRAISLFREHPQSPLEPAAARGVPASAAVRLRPRAALRGRSGVGLRRRAGHDVGRRRRGDRNAAVRAERRARAAPRRLADALLDRRLRRRRVPAVQGCHLGQLKTYGGGRYLLDTIKSADLGTAADGRDRSSTSTLPTTRPAPIPTAGPARSRRPTTRCRRRSALASGWARGQRGSRAAGGSLRS